MNDPVFLNDESRTPIGRADFFDFHGQQSHSCVALSQFMLLLLFPIFECDRVGSGKSLSQVLDSLPQLILLTGLGQATIVDDGTSEEVLAAIPM